MRAMIGEPSTLEIPPPAHEQKIIPKVVDANLAHIFGWSVVVPISKSTEDRMQDSHLCLTRFSLLLMWPIEADLSLLAATGVVETPWRSANFVSALRRQIPESGHQVSPPDD